MSSADPPQDDVDDREPVFSLLANIKVAMPQLRQLWRDCDDQWGFEDPVYRFYHQSWKVYGLQDRTMAIVAALQALAPDRDLNEWFLEIVSAGTGKKFARGHNKRWLEVTRPILEAFFHAKYFLEMAIRYGKLEKPPKSLPSGWAALLYLYDLRYDVSPAVLERVRKHLAARRKGRFPPPPTSLDDLPTFTNEAFVRHLSAVGYPPFRYVKPHPHPKNPTALILWALNSSDAEPRLVEGLPWILLSYPDLDVDWLVREAKLHELQNRLGLFVQMAHVVATKTACFAARAKPLAALLKILERSRLAREETLFGEATTPKQLEITRVLRGPEAAHWNLVTLWKPEHLRPDDW